MFNCYEFTFDGESSAMYGLMVYDIGGRGQSDVSFGNKASIVETRTNNSDSANLLWDEYPQQAT